MSSSIIVELLRAGRRAALSFRFLSFRSLCAASCLFVGSMAFGSTLPVVTASESRLTADE
jgi:hypothetical protein